jgi:two-component system chemotaxis sensor kinase CheA
VVEDDGAGIDIDAVRAKARALGLVQSGDRDDEQAVLAMLFLPGVSTRVYVDAAAGRGVGLDLVHREIALANGAITVATERGQYTRFAIEITMRAIAERMLVVWAARERLAIPLDRVERIVSHPRDVPDVSVVSLARVAGIASANDNASEDDDASGEIVIVNTTSGSLGLRIERVDRAREFVVRPLPALLAGLPPWGFATVDGEGNVMLVLDVDHVRG